MPSVCFICQEARERELQHCPELAGFEITTFEAAGDAVAAWRKADRPYPDVVVIDLSQAGLSAVISTLHAEHVAAALVGLYASSRGAIEAMRMGFNDCIPRSADNRTVGLCVQAAVRERQRMLTRAQFTRLLDVMRGQEQELDLDRLTRELVASAGETTWLHIGGRLYPGGGPLELQDQEIATLTARGKVQLGDRILYRITPHAALLCRLRFVPTVSEQTVAAILGLVSAPRWAESSSRAVERAQGNDDAFAALGRAAKSLDHDLRNPLCALSLNVQLLAITIDANGDDKTLTRLESIRTSADKIKSIIDEMSRVKRELPVTAG